MNLVPVRLTSDYAADGQNWRSLQSGLMTKQLVKVRHGAYAADLAEDVYLRHWQLIDATLPRVAPGAVLSHRSAAVLHGLPVWPEEPMRVHITRERRSGGRRSPHLWVHSGPLEAQDVVELCGLSVTSLARTVADLARALSLDHAVATSDAALRLGLDRDRLEVEAERSERRRGARQLRFVVGFSDGRAESPGESFSRVRMHQVKLPPPDLQCKVVQTRTGRAHRCDFGWEEQRTVGEFDGRAKYGRLLKPGQDPGEVVFAEKVREDEIREVGQEMVRWISPDLGRPRLFRERILAAFARGRRRWT